MPVLADKLKQRLRAQAVHKHRLMLRKHFDINKGAFRIHGNEQIDRQACESGDRRHVDALKDIADEFVFRGVLFEQRPDRNLSVPVAHDIRGGETRDQIGFGEYAGPAHGQPQYSQHKQDKTELLARHGIGSLEVVSFIFHCFDAIKQSMCHVFGSGC